MLPLNIKEGECYFTKRNVASHSMHHNENGECMSGGKYLFYLQETFWTYFRATVKIRICQIGPFVGIPTEDGDVGDWNKC